MAILEIQERSLTDWLGSEEAARVGAIIANAEEVHRQNVLARIERRSAEFAKRCPTGSPQYRDAAQRAQVRPEPYSSGDSACTEAWCPACGLPVWVEGLEFDREVIDEKYEYDPEDGCPYGCLRTVRVHYGAEYLDCPECELVLEGRDEIEIAEVEADFTREVEEEPDLYEEYGNE